MSISEEYGAFKEPCFPCGPLIFDQMCRNLGQLRVKLQEKSKTKIAYLYAARVGHKTLFQKVLKLQMKTNE